MIIFPFQNVETLTKFLHIFHEQANEVDLHEGSDKSNSVTFVVCRCSGDCKNSALLNSDDYFENDESVITEDEPLDFPNDGSLTHLNNQNVQAHIQQLNKEIQSLNYRVKHLFMSASSVEQTNQSPEPKRQSKTPEHTVKSPRRLQTIDSETEHIYETIPDDDPSEFYCDPYDSQWKKSESINLPQTPQRPDLTITDSLNNNCGSRKSPVVSRAPQTTRSPKSGDQKRELRKSLAEKIPTSSQMPKPNKMSNSQSVPISLSQAASSSSTADNRHSTMISNSAASTLEASKTMYTNIVNLEQTILLQQNLYRQAMKKVQKEGDGTASAGIFVAPNLEQYKFVNGQQVSQWNFPFPKCCKNQ